MNISNKEVTRSYNQAMTAYSKGQSHILPVRPDFFNGKRSRALKQFLKRHGGK